MATLPASLQPNETDPTILRHPDLSAAAPETVTTASTSRTTELTEPVAITPGMAKEGSLLCLNDTDLQTGLNHEESRQSFSRCDGPIPALSLSGKADPIYGHIWPFHGENMPIQIHGTALHPMGTTWPPCIAIDSLKVGTAGWTRGAPHPRCSPRVCFGPQDRAWPEALTVMLTKRPQGAAVPKMMPAIPAHDVRVEYRQWQGNIMVEQMIMDAAVEA